MEKPNCSQCQYFYITFDPETPRGCRLYRFVTARIPSQVIQQQSGMKCMGFRPKASKSQVTKETSSPRVKDIVQISERAKNQNSS